MARKRSEDLATLVAGIYEAAVDPALWFSAGSQIARKLKSRYFVLAPTSADIPSILPQRISPTLAQPYMELMRQYPGDTNAMIGAARGLDLRPGSVVTDRELVDDQRWKRSEAYNEFFKPLDVEHVCVLMLEVYQTPRKEFVHFTLNRGSREPDYSAADQRLIAALFPHFQRAAEIHRKVQGQANLAHFALEALDRVPSGLLVLSATGNVMHANAAAEAMLRRNDGLALRQGRFRAGDDRLTAQLLTLVSGAILGFGLDPPASGGAMLLPRPSELPAWQVIVSPLAPNNPYSVGPAHAAALVMVTDPSAETSAPHVILSALFGFTPAESRMALALANGMTPQEIAQRHELSLLTVRTHIRRLHDKLGVRSQAQLIRRVLQATLLLRRPQDSGSILPSS